MVEKAKKRAKSEKKAAVPAQDVDGGSAGRVGIRDITERKRAEETLRESETSLQAVLQSTADGILAVNRENQVLFANDRFIQMWRIPPPVMAGKDDAVLLQHVLDQLVDPQGFLQQVRELYKSEAESFDTLYFKDGRVFERLSRPLMRAAKLDGRVWSFRDVTEKKLAEKEIINLNRLYAMLSQTNQSIVRMQTRDELFKEACRVAIDYGKFCLVWIGLYSSDQDKIIPYTWAGKEIGFFENDLSNTPRELIDSLPWIRAFHENQTVVINDVAVDPNCEYWRESARQRGFHSLAAIPLFLNDLPIGVFVFYSSEANFFVEKEINLLREVGIDLSFALNRFDIEIKRKRAEEALRESETRFRIALENSPIVVFNQDRELRYTWIHNPHPGFDPRAMLGKTDAELLPADDAARLTEIKRRVLENGVTARAEVKTTIGGQAFFYDLTVEPLRDLKEKIIGVTCASLDITDRKRAEAALQASEARYRLLVENAQEAILVAQDGLHKFVNQKAVETFGYPESELLSRPFLEFIHPDDREKVMDNYGKRLAGETAQPRYVFRLLTGDGGIRWVEVGSVRIDWAGRPAALIFLIDITDRHKAEGVIQASLREKEVLLREIHHRVKNNMQVVSSLFNLQIGHIKDEDARRMLKEGQLRIRSMALVHEKLYRSRDLSKIDFADYLRSLADHLYQFFQVRAGRIRLETDLEQIHLDVNSAVPCGLLASELISNALKHAFPEGREGAVELGLRRKKDGAVELRVADDGVGLPDSMDFRHAEGFGLQIVILLVGQLEGTIELDRKKGAAFTIIFPEEKAGQSQKPVPRTSI